MGPAQRALSSPAKAGLCWPSRGFNRQADERNNRRQGGCVTRGGRSEIRVTEGRANKFAATITKPASAG